MAPSPVRYLSDDALQQGANARCENYWCAYLPDIADQMGLTADPVSRDDLVSSLPDTRVLILPDLPPGYLTVLEADGLKHWVERGGILIGIATEGLDDLFGIQTLAGIGQPEDPWSYSAMLRLTDPEMARNLYSPDTLDAPLLVVSPARVIAAQGRELARLLSIEGDDLAAPAVALRDVQEGKACYFAFNLCQTLWCLHHGRPISTDRDGDGWLRMSDAIIIRPHRIDVPYADLLLFLLRNVVALADVWFKHPLPATPAGTVADAVFHWGGDDEGDATGIQQEASDFMRSRNLPYHVNIMPHPGGEFGLSPEGFAHLKANGHETSLHVNMIEGFEHPNYFTEEDVRSQVRRYREVFGETPICTVFHCCTWHGSTEPAEWLAAEGIAADNCRIHAGSPPANPVNLLGYSFGTAFPFWYRSDWRQGNRRIDFLSLQVNAYETGYDGEGTATTWQHRAIRDAAFWQLTMNMFHHPLYLARFPQAQEAIDEFLRVVAKMCPGAIQMGNDELTLWWRARSAARLDEGEQGEPLLRAEGEAWRDGYVVMRRDPHGEAGPGGGWEYRVLRG